MISLLVLKFCFPQVEKMLFREKRVQFRKRKTQINKWLLLVRIALERI